MQRYFLFLPCLLFSISLSAQYDFPIVYNGLSISLGLGGDIELSAKDFLVNGVQDCAYTDSVLISRAIPIFPRDSVPPGSALSTITFSCLDGSSESVEIWYYNQHGQWSVSDSYVVIVGNEGCTCEIENCTTVAPICYNGYSVSFGGQTDSIVVNAREFVIESLPGVSYSYSLEPNDSIRTYYCGNDGIEPVLIYGHQAGLLPRFTSTYLALEGVDQCTDADYNGLPARVIQGLSVPNTSAEIVSVPARAFASKYGPPQKLAFSTDPNDTLLTLNCDLIGLGGIFIELYNHSQDLIGTPAITYLVGDGSQNHCADAPENTAPHDLPANALALEDCRLFQQFNQAKPEPNAFLPPEAGGSVWYQLSTVAFPAHQRILIESIDSLYFALYATIPDSQMDTPLAQGLVTEMSSTQFCPDPTMGDFVYLQISQLRPEANCRFYLQRVADACSNLAEETAIENPVLIYPTPAHNVLHIRSIDDYLASGTINLINTQGQLIKSVSTNAHWREFNLDTSEIPNGVYWLSWQDGTHYWSQKCIISHH